MEKIPGWRNTKESTKKVSFKNKSGAVLDMNKGTFKKNSFWTVDASYNDGFGRKYFVTRQTKSAARDTAENYMKAHPRGQIMLKKFSFYATQPIKTTVTFKTKNGKNVTFKAIKTI